jgi:acyl dehydratase
VAIDVQRLKAWPFGEIEHAYTERDSALYALCLGYGADPTDERALRYAYGPELQAAPSMASVLGFPGQWMREPESGIDWVQVVHGEQRTRLRRPLPAAATVRARTRVKSVVDKGAGKGALVLMSRDIRDAASGALLATVEQLNFCRGDGGFSASGQPGDEAPAPPPPMPQREADVVCDIETRPETALLYRLCGDMNPLHADPGVARAAGFARPILHGLATYGIAGHALLKTLCGHDATRLRTLEARFSSPVYPGETLRTEIWRGDDHAVFRTKALKRNVVVLNHGRAELC